MSRRAAARSTRRRCSARNAPATIQSAARAASRRCHAEQAPRAASAASTATRRRDVASRRRRPARTTRAPGSVRCRKTQRDRGRRHESPSSPRRAKRSSARGATILVRSMRSRVLRRRSATALGVYVATALGFLTTVVATRELGVDDYARFAAILAATTFFQVLLDLTVEDALVKYGFRYVEAERWGRLRRIFEVALALQARRRPARRARDRRSLAPFAQEVWGVDGVLVPMLIAARCRSSRRPRRSRAARSSCAAATTCAARSSPSRRALRLVGIGDRHAVRARRRGARDGGRAGRRDGRRSRSSGSPRSGASRRRAPSRSASDRRRGAAVRRSRRRSARRSSRRARRSARRCCRPSRRSTRPRTSATRRRRRPGFATLSRAGAARAADRADTRLRGGPPRPRCTRCCAATSSARRR